MRLIPMRPINAVFAAALLAGSTAPSLAQDSAPAGTSSGNERVNALIVYGNDPCPQSQGDEITVCARKDESERYRIPKDVRETPSTTSEAWASRVRAYERVGKTGTQSCSAVGAGAWTGCAAQLIDNAYAEKKAGEDVQFGKAIAEARSLREQGTDAEAAATQARVEQAEKDYEARQRANAEAEAAAKAGK
ncbi:MAG: hypothetical protein ABI673_02650 [Novosphingobium sp.]